MSVTDKTKSARPPKGKVEFVAPERVQTLNIVLRSQLSAKELRKLAQAELQEHDIQGQYFTVVQLPDHKAQVMYFDSSDNGKNIASKGNSNVIPIYALGRCFAEELQFESDNLQIFAFISHGVVFAMRGHQLEHYVGGLEGRSALESEIRRLIKFQKLATTNQVEVFSDTQFDTIDSAYIDSSRLPLANLQAGEFLRRWSWLQVFKNRLQIKVNATFNMQELFSSLQRNLYALIVAVVMVLLVIGAWQIKQNLEQHLAAQKEQFRQLNDQLTLRTSELLSRLESQSSTLSVRIKQVNELMTTLQPQQQQLLARLEAQSQQQASPRQRQARSPVRRSDQSAVSAGMPDPASVPSGVTQAGPDNSKPSAAAASDKARPDAPQYSHSVKLLTSDYVLVEFTVADTPVTVRLAQNQRTQVLGRVFATYFSGSGQLRIEAGRDVKHYPLNI